jgi:HK97 family phage prohead protease
LARTRSGTLTLEEDDYGLRIEAQLDEDNPDARKIMSALRRGDISQMSFAFETVKDSWSTDKRTRELREVKLFDVSVVTYPAYEETVAELRSRTSTQADTVLPTTARNLRKRQIELLQLRAGH